jgi:hypothetical protein
MNNIQQPKEGEYANYFKGYLALNSTESYQEQLMTQIESCFSLFETKGEEWANKAYAEGKWTPKEVLGHIIDTERIMTFRALCFARGEKSPLPGFEQDEYVANAEFNQVHFQDLLKDFKNHRLALLSLIKTLPEESLSNLGLASGNSISPRALFWIIPGHFAHHFSILKERY